MLETIREAAYGSNLRLPFETLADEAMLVAEKSKRKTKRHQAASNNSALEIHD